MSHSSYFTELRFPSSGVDISSIRSALRKSLRQLLQRVNTFDFSSPNFTFVGSASDAPHSSHSIRSGAESSVGSTISSFEFAPFPKERMGGIYNPSKVLKQRTEPEPGPALLWGAAFLAWGYSSSSATPSSEGPTLQEHPKRVSSSSGT